MGLMDSSARKAIEKMLAEIGEKKSEKKGAKGETPGLRGIVIDMRNNSGGLLAQAIEVLDHVVTKGELVIVRSASGRESEAAREQVGKGGVVRDPGVRAATVTRIREWAAAHGFDAGEAVESPIRGPAGNVEYLLRLTAPSWSEE